MLKKHRWPGNIRELSHTIERAMILSDGEELSLEDLSLTAALPNRTSDSMNLEANERRLVETALRDSGGNVSRAAATLGITRAALYRRMEKFDL
jgi:transcriptional regulator of acetoin/glycerol metabolism